MVFGVAAAYFLYTNGYEFGAFFIVIIMFMGLAGGEAQVEDDEDEAGPEAPRRQEDLSTQPPAEDRPPEFPI